MVAPLRRRPLDLVLCLFFGVFALTSLLFDSLTALDVDLARSSWPPARANHWFAANVDPFLLKPPLFARIVCGISAFVFGPLYLAMLYAFVKGRNWVRPLAIGWSAAILHSLAVWFGVELFGPVPPLDLPMFFAAYLPYVIAPLLLLYRMRAPQPFTALPSPA